MAKVDLNGITPNSYTYKEQNQQKRTSERKKLDPVVEESNVVQTKKSKRRKLLNAIFQEDLKDLKSKIIYDMIIPGTKRWFLDSLSMLLMHEPYRGDYRGGSYFSRSSGPRDYSSYYSGGRSNNNSSRKEEYIDYRDIVLNNRYDAEKIVRELHDRIRDQGYASIADLYDLMRIPSKFTDENWGWDDERSIRVTSTREGFLVDVEDAKRVGR